MAYTKGGTLTDQVKEHRTHLAAVAAFLRHLDAELADPEDLRVIGGQLRREHHQAVGLPVDRQRFDRPAAERAREELTQAIEDLHRTALATSRR